MTPLAIGLALVISSAAAAAPTGDSSEEDRWLLLRAREWMARIGLSEGGWDGDVAAGLRDAGPLPPTDPLIRELEPLLRTVARDAPLGLFRPQGPVPVPDPSWTFAWLDVDGDGRREIVLAGGTGPAPFYAVLQSVQAEGRVTWRILHRAPFRFLGAAAHAGRVHFFGAFDGYGIEGAALTVDTVDPSSAPTGRRLRLDLPGWDARPLAPGTTVEDCTTARRTKLRTEPRVDDAPREDGLGGSFAGNLLQTLEKGSTGWRLDAEKGTDGRVWALCFFVGPSPRNLHQTDREMASPRRLTRAPLAPGESVIVGWVAVENLAQGAASPAAGAPR
jgi:hypothetical protein